ncbi:proline iminopeptidase [Melghirimyces profundicolus]|uniref:Proline iminopeptidase n=1 Tax=Melghirimyces profundicolus TaxID=1242148 RepID=A0A2T6C0L5_9BACL|nr:alpha/beta fold hydrolase [Melghirimyces profundicolus]PTX61859.1 proline iminopeptidase [Melghirimyces profundicolus]
MEVYTEYRKAKGFDIFVKRLGSGEPIVFLHGGPGDEHRYFLPHVTPLANDFTLIFYDQRGCGQSAAPHSTAFNMKDEMEALEELRESLGMQKMNLLGQSWGTILGLFYAVHYPEHVSRLMLVSYIGLKGADLKRFGELLADRMTEKENEELNNLENNTYHLTPEERQKKLTDLVFPYYLYNRENLKRITPTRINHKVNKQICDDILANYDVEDLLYKLDSIPVMIIQGAKDLITPDICQETLKKVPHAKMEIFHQSGHWPFLEEPEKFISVTKPFFNHT